MTLTCLFIVGLVWPSSCYFAMIFEAFPGLKGSASSLASALRMLLMAGCVALNGRLYQDAFRSVGVLAFLIVCAAFPLVYLAQRQARFEVEPGGGTH